MTKVVIMAVYTTHLGNLAQSMMKIMESVADRKIMPTMVPEVLAKVAPKLPLEVSTLYCPVN